MSEKKGFTGKLKYDFDTARNLEVFLTKSNRWHRVTAREFRSWLGSRRIEGVAYEGPVYHYGTNVLSKDESLNGSISNHNWKSERRQYEEF